MTKAEELMNTIKTLVEASPYCSTLKMSRNNWELLGRPQTLFGLKVNPIDGFPDERIYATGD